MRFKIFIVCNRAAQFGARGPKFGPSALAQIWNTFGGTGDHARVGLGDYTDVEVKDFEFPEGIVGELLEGWYLFFWKVSKQFMFSKDGNPIFKDAKNPKGIPFHLKLTYDKKGNLQLPKFGNVMVRYAKGKETSLQMTGKDKFTKNAPLSFAQTTAPDTTSALAPQDDDLPPGF